MAFCHHIWVWSLLLSMIPSTIWGLDVGGVDFTDKSAALSATKYYQQLINNNDEAGLTDLYDTWLASVNNKLITNGGSRAALKRSSAEGYVNFKGSVVKVVDVNTGGAKGWWAG